MKPLAKKLDQAESFAKEFSWGLKSLTDHSLIPLKTLDITVKIIHNVARVFYTQVYYHEQQKALETEFLFPIGPDACFDSFIAKFNDTTIRGVIKEKEKAKEDYRQGLKEGKTVAYSEIAEEQNNIMKVLIGNIPPNTPISITYSYIQKMETSLNKFWLFHLFSALTPRYRGNLVEHLQNEIPGLSNYPVIKSADPNANIWSIKVEIQSPSPITLVKSPSHAIEAVYGHERHTCAVCLTPTSHKLPNKDFVLLYCNGRENMLDYAITPFEDGYCAMLTFLADFDKNISTEDAYKSFETAKEPAKAYEMSSIQGEYIFLLDRSGSMSGKRIELAKNSLLLFLKSLPPDSYMNVISFGTKHRLESPESIRYSQESLLTLTQRLQGFSADMQGTEIYQPLEVAFNLPEKKGYPRSIFLLTDGDISNVEQVLGIIEKNTKKARVFTIGVGNECSPELITKGAIYGRGKYEFVGDSNEIYEKVVSLLDASISPCFYDLSLNSGNFDALVKCVSPNPTDVRLMLNGEHITFFLFIRKEGFADGQKMNISLKMYDSTLKNYRTIEIALDAAETLENDMLPKLAIHDMIKKLEAQKDSMNLDKSRILWIDKAEIKKTLVDFSLKYGVLCKETAFFCDIDNAIYKPMKREKIDINDIIGTFGDDSIDKRLFKGQLKKLKEKHPVEAQAQTNNQMSHTLCYNASSDDKDKKISKVPQKKKVSPAATAALLAKRRFEENEMARRMEEERLRREEEEEERKLEEEMERKKRAEEKQKKEKDVRKKELLCRGEYKSGRMLKKREEILESMRLQGVLPLEGDLIDKKTIAVRTKKKKAYKNKEEVADSSLNQDRSKKEDEGFGSQSSDRIYKEKYGSAVDKDSTLKQESIEEKPMTAKSRSEADETGWETWETWEEEIKIDKEGSKKEKVETLQEEVQIMDFSQLKKKKKQAQKKERSFEGLKEEVCFEDRDLVPARGKCEKERKEEYVPAVGKDQVFKKDSAKEKPMMWEEAINIKVEKSQKEKGETLQEEEWSIPPDQSNKKKKKDKKKETQKKEEFTESSNKEASYLDVIMKQNFEGSWDPRDRDLVSKIFKVSQSIPSVPEKLKELNIPSIEVVWMTILVLVWLEVVCSKERQAWKFIHQKGCEWLKRQGVSYEEMKEVANAFFIAV